MTQTNYLFLLLNAINFFAVFKKHYLIKYGTYFLVVKITAHSNNKYIINLQKEFHAAAAGLMF